MTGNDDSIIGNHASVRAEALYVHGLFMTGREGWLLRRRLLKRGFGCASFAYSSRRERSADVVARLADRLARNPDLNLVGHSLGGVISALALARVPAWRGRAVLLGPPLSGSDTARRAARLPGGRRLLGRGGCYLVDGVARAAGSGRMLVVAGTRNVGIGRLIGACAGPGDGQVRVLETRLPGSPRLTRRRGHMALLFDRRVARTVADFLDAG